MVFSVVVRAGSALAKSTVPAGTRLGRYEIIATIASGGMATVYLGRALGAAGFQRLVAIKCLHPHVAADEQFVSMFMDEARLAARIRHPNVVPTLDLENGPDGLFLVMEYVEGDGLLGLLRAAARSGEPMPPMIAFRIVLDVLHGLHAAHELTGDRGEPLRIVHRDISPHNVLVGTDGITRITDFGIARAEERITHTREGQIKGKLSYMAPEQTSSEPVDRRADLWSAGVVLWECLAARRLFRGDSDAEVLRNLLDAPIPRLTELRPDYPPGLDDVMSKALARRPEDRYATAAEFAEALEEAGAVLGVASTRAVSSYVRRLAGAKVGALQDQARVFTGDRTSVPPAPAMVAGTGSDEVTQTPLRDSVAQLAAAAAVAEETAANTDTAIRIARGQLVIPATPGPNPAYATLDLPPPMAPPATVSTASVPPRSSSRGPIVLGLVLVLLLVGTGAAAAAVLVFLRSGPATGPAEPVGQTTAEPVSAPTDPSEPTGEPAVDPATLPAATATHGAQAHPTPRPVGPKHPGTKPTASAATSATAPTAPATTAAPPASNLPFNPEAM